MRQLVRVGRKDATTPSRMKMRTPRPAIWPCGRCTAALAADVVSDAIQSQPGRILLIILRVLSAADKSATGSTATAGSLVLQHDLCAEVTKQQERVRRLSGASSLDTSVALVMVKSVFGYGTFA